MDRRRFLKVTAATGASVALASCGHPENQIVRFIPEDEFVSGVATWKPSICPLCPAGCGLHVRVMDADVDVVRGGERGVMRAAVAKKLEGLAAHPVNRGALCARGQAAIQITYHPDRLRHPMKRNGPRGSGQYQEISWEEALAELASRLDALTGSNRQSALAYLSKPQQSHRSELVDLFLQRFGAPPRVRVSIFDEDVLRRANAISFGREQLPTIDLGQSRFVIGFGADFLGTWNSPVAQGAGYGAMRQGTRGVRGTFVQVESRMSQTGANADEWIPARPGTEGALALGLAHVIVRDRGTGGFAAFTPAHVESVTGVPAAQIERLARSFASAKPAVAIIGGPALAHSNGLAQALAVNALNTLAGSVGMPGGIQFTPALPGRKNAEATVAPKTLASLAAQMLGGASSPIDVVLIDDANPVFLSPGSWRVREALERVPFVASFSSFLDETSILADLILPDHSFLESWIDNVPESGTTIATAAVAGPVMRPLYSTRATPDVLLEVAKRLKQPLSPPLPWPDFGEMLRERLTALPVPADSPDAWAAAQERGGWWAVPSKPVTSNPEPSNPEPSNLQTPNPEPPWEPPSFDGDPGSFPFHLIPYASTTFYDGSTAHLPWLQEMPDPMTSAMWSNWIEINPRTAERLQLATGDMVEITSQYGSVRAPMVVTPGIAPEVVAMPVGQGHESFTRYASGRGSNPLTILAPVVEPRSGAVAWAATRVKVARVGDGRGALTLFAGSALEHHHEHR
jgi:anaerobic selenocysteine-containing dehydrogenase